MRLSSRKVTVTVVVVVLSLAGLITLQASLLKSAMALKEQAFHRNVMAALSQVSHALTTREAIMLSLSTDSAGVGLVQARIESTTFDRDSLANGQVNYSVIMQDSMQCLPSDIDSIVFPLNRRRPANLVIHVDDSSIGRDARRLEFRDSTMMNVDGGTLVMKSWVNDHVVTVPGDSGRFVKTLSLTGNRKLKMLNAVFENLLEMEFEPIEQRLDSVNVDSVLSATFHDNGIDLDYAYGVISVLDDSLRLVKPDSYADEVRSSDFFVQLFPLDVLAPPAHLAVFFPSRQAYLWKQIGPLLAVTSVLMLIITGCFAYTIRTIIRQRRVSDHLVGFINNMTHEFKTPISSVALATEAIRRPDVNESKDRVLHYNAMIETENRRMRNQTEKILQMAALEDHDIEFNRDAVDMHKVIAGVIATMSLHVQGRKGSITTELNARHHLVRGDRTHLTNVIYNLVDNANKYSPDHPTIAIKTFDGNQGLSIRIEDRGMGMSPTDSKRAFEKYFRAATGNRHDVKGFGLGLSYVKLMIEAHGGEISLYSELGQGTQVEMTVPTLQPENT